MLRCDAVQRGRESRGIDRRRLKEILRRGAGATDFGSRIDRISTFLLGAPYRANPLVGSAYVPEELTAPLDAFDCVTYVETVYAAAISRDEDEFVVNLRRLRYGAGIVSFARRNHYMTEWIRNARRAGLARPVALGPGEVEKRRVLNVVPGLPPVRQRFRCLPKRLVRRVDARLRTGDLVCFASTRSHLDVFHCGLVVRYADRLRMRHASRSQGGVLEQDLAGFLGENRMAGILVARPMEKGRR